MNNGKILISKGVGKVAEVDKNLNFAKLPGQIGIGHTRWATHGGVSDSNAHPHFSCTSDIAVVHNGIIENYDELKDVLLKEGHVFRSQTDSEVIPHLLEKYCKEFDNDYNQALIETCKNLKGSFAFVAVFKNGLICGARFDEPLIIGVAPSALFLSSDVLGFLKYTDKAIFLDNGDIVTMENGQYEIFNLNNDKVFRPITQVAWELGSTEKGKFAHHTLKEIYEQPSILFNSLNKNNDFQKFCNYLKTSSHVYITGSGTSYHSGLLAKHLLAKFAKIRSEVIMSSEFHYFSDTLESDSAIIAISQSGETADVLHAVKKAKEAGSKILSIVNIPTSSLARISDAVLVLNCGPEIGVAATKSFTGQLMILYNIANFLSNNKLGLGVFSQEKLVGLVKNALNLDNNIKSLVADLDDEIKDIYILGRSIHYPIALEGSLKIKELAYIHAEGIAAGELKHGPLALIDSKSLVIVINPYDGTYQDIVSSAHEIKSRGAKIIGISNKNNIVYDHYLEIPECMDYLYPIVEVIPLQLMAYYLSLKMQVDPDYPRNLAKSVTVK
jgi:glucosamine--fructose-6-phosphate aminotransferase (isomerizing)